MGIGIDNNDIQGSAWGAAFRNKPIMLKTHAEVAAFLDLGFLIRDETSSLQLLSHPV